MKNNIVFFYSFLTIIFILGGCNLTESLFDKHRVICSKSASIVIFDQSVWQEYKKRANNAFLNRKNGHSEALPSLPEYVPGFDYRYGVEMAKNRTYLEGEIINSDINILKNGKLIATFVDFIVSLKALDGNTNIDCTGLYPELYLKDVDVNE